MRRGGAADAEELRAVDELLAQSASMDHHDVDPGKKTTIADVLRLPFLMASMAFWFARLAFVGFVVGPLLALLWRSRRYLADATAVQLTRNPDGVARGLAALASRGAAVPGGGWAAPLFLVGPASGPSGGFRGDDLGIVSYSPPAAKRLARLRRQGATVEMRAPGGLPGLARLCIGLFASIVGVALVSCALMLSYLALIIDMLILAPVVMAIHGLLRYWSPG